MSAPFEGDPVEELVAEPVGGAPAPPLATLDDVRAALRAELDEVIPHVVGALKRNDAVADLAQRLDGAERRLAQRDQRPLISRLYRLLGVVRRLDLPGDVRTMLTGELEDLLRGAGYTEFGEVGDAFAADRHEALDGTATHGSAQIVEVYEPGLQTLGEIVVPARVRVSGVMNESGQARGDQG